MPGVSKGYKSNMRIDIIWESGWLDGYDRAKGE